MSNSESPEAVVESMEDMVRRVVRLELERALHPERFAGNNPYMAREQEAAQRAHLAEMARRQAELSRPPECRFPPYRSYLP